MVENESLGNPQPIQDRIQELLQTNQSVFFAGVMSNAPFYNIERKPVEHFSFVVAPINPIFNPEALNKFMKSLTPGINPTTSEEAESFFDLSPRGGLILGQLCFSEDTQTNVNITDPQGGLRKINVRVFPDAYSAAIYYFSELGRRTTLPFRESLDPYQVRKLRKLHKKVPEERILEVARGICQAADNNSSRRPPFLIKHYRTY